MDFQEFEKNFGTETQCFDYLFNLRWKNGYRCPICNHNEMWQIKDYKYKCKKCKYQTTVISKTLFQDTHLPMTLWFKAMWYITSSNEKVTATKLQKDLGIGSNRTVLQMLKKLNYAKSINNDRKVIEKDYTKLQGTVEISRKSIKTPKTAIPVAVAVEVIDKKIGRVKADTIDSLYSDKLNSFIMNNIEVGSTLICSGWNNFDELKEKGYIHKQKEHKYTFKYAESILLKLQNYLNNDKNQANISDCLESFCAEYNHPQKTTLTFEELVNNAINLQPMPYGKNE